MVEVFGEERKVTVAKELTKQFERFITGSLQFIVAELTEHSDWVRGEFVIIVSGYQAPKVEAVEFEPLMLLLIEQGLPVKQISEIVAKHHGVKKKLVYQMVLDRQK